MKSMRTSSFSISWPLGQKTDGVSYLPPNKQYLMAKRVLCLTRALAPPSSPGEEYASPETGFTPISSEEMIIDHDPV